MTLYDITDQELRIALVALIWMYLDMDKFSDWGVKTRASMDKVAAQLHFEEGRLEAEIVKQGLRRGFLQK